MRGGEAGGKVCLGSRTMPNHSVSLSPPPIRSNELDQPDISIPILLTGWDMAELGRSGVFTSLGLSTHLAPDAASCRSGSDG